MALLVSAKGTDVLAWRTSGDFTATYRQLLLARLEYCRANEAQDLMSGTARALDDLARANDVFCDLITHLMEEIPVCTHLQHLREICSEFFTALYEHVGIHHSAPAFYELTTQFLQSLSGAIIRYAHSSLGLLDRKTPQIKLVALGPAGRQEFSPFCPLQLMLVHAEAGDAEQETLSQLGRLIHEGFEICGFLVDETITVRNYEWRGSMAEWQQRVMQRLEYGRAEELVDLFRLADQSTLHHDEGFDPEISTLCRTALKENRPAMAFQVSRVGNLSHGIGIMGGMRFQRKGSFRGKFALRDHGMQPLSAAIGTLALLKNLEAPSTPRRIREILWKRQLNVDMAERLLHAWHTLHELRLIRERDVHPDWSNEAPFHLDVEEMPNSGQDSLRESLEAVGAIQRQVGLTFSGMEG